MGCIHKIFISTIFTISTLTGIIPIATKVSSYPKEFGRHQGPPTDWEPGLREAANQALIRERFGGINLREGLLNAPIVGKRNNASPFGDIAILARGQLVATASGFEFVQDRFHNDYIDRPCKYKECQGYSGIHKVLALWTVKRIRHRDADYGHRYELEYTISPVKEGIIPKREGYDYALPGHVFIVRLSSRGVERNSFKIYNRDHYIKSNYPIFVNTDQPNEYQKPPHHYLPQPSPLTPVTPHEYNHQNKEYELYHNLLNSLAQKTKFDATTKETYHRFGPPTKGTTQIVYERPKSTDPTFFTTHSVKFTNSIPIPASTVQPFTTTVFIPTYEITKHTTPTLQHSTPSYTTHHLINPTQYLTTPYAITEPYTTSQHTTQQMSHYLNTKVTRPTLETSPYSNIFTTSLSYPTTSKLTTSYFTPAKPSNPPTIPGLLITEKTEIDHQTKPDILSTQNTANTIDSHFSTTHKTTLKQTTQGHFTPSETPLQSTLPYFTTPEYLTQTQIKTTSPPIELTSLTYSTFQNILPNHTHYESTAHEHTTESLTNRVPPTNSPIPTFYIDPNHPGYPKTTPTTPFASDDVPFTKHPFIASPPYVQYSEPDLSTNAITHGTRPATSGSTTLSLPNTDRYFPPSTPHEIHLPTTPHKPNTPFIKPTIPEEFIPHRPPDDEELELFPEDKNKPTPKITTTPPPPKPTDGFLLRDDDYIPIKKHRTNETELFEKETTSKPVDITQRTNTKDINEVFTTNTTKHPVLPSNSFADLFEARRPKSNTETTTVGLKIIYSDFYAAATTEATSKETDNPKHTIPSTSQSYSTSVTFEVNKNKRTQKALTELVTTSTEMSPSKQLDDLALSVVNHARSLDYLENKKVKKVKRRRKGYIRKVIKKVI